MGGFTEEEGSLVLPDGTSLYSKSWKTEGTPRAILAFYHGFSDHCDSFFEFFPNLASSGFEVRSVDQRGWGHSVLDNNRKLRGNFGSTATVMADLHFFLQSLIPFTKEGTIPLFLMGHSMGGMNVLYYVLNPDSPYHHQQQTGNNAKVKLAGVLSVAPLVAVHPSTQPLKIVEYAGRIAKRIVPKVTMVQKIEPKWVSKSTAVQEDIVNDKGRLYHNTGSLEGLGDMLDRGAWLNDYHKKASKLDNAHKADVPPLWVGHGTDDRITWFDATKRLVEALNWHGDTTFKEYADAYHKLMNEPDGVGEAMTKDVTEWMEARLPK